MTAPVAVSQRSGHAVGSQLSNAQTDALRALLLAQVEKQTATLARCAAAMTARAPDDTTGLGRAMDALHMYGAREAIEEIEGALARIDAGGYGTSTTAADAPDAVRRLVALAGQLLREDPRQEGLHPGGSPDQLAAPLQRVARLRRELHVTANRVARFGVDEHPILDPVRVSAPIASSAGLAPGRLLFQLDLAAGRLVALLDALSADDWTRAGRMGDRVMTLGELVERVLHTGSHDILDLLHAAPEGVAILTDERSRRDRSTSPRPRSSPGRKVDQGAAAS